MAKYTHFTVKRLRIFQAFLTQKMCLISTPQSKAAGANGRLLCPNADIKAKHRCEKVENLGFYEGKYQRKVNRKRAPTKQTHFRDENGPVNQQAKLFEKTCISQKNESDKARVWITQKQAKHLERRLDGSVE